MSKLRYLLALLVVLLPQLTMSSASAVSVYDGAVQVSDRLILKNTAASSPSYNDGVDITYTYMKYVEEICPSTFASIQNATYRYVSMYTEDAHNNGTYLFTYTVISVSGTSDPLAHIQWSTAYGGSIQGVGMPRYSCRFYIHNDAPVGDTYAHSDIVSGFESQGSPLWTSSKAQVFLSTYPVAYPTGYEGESIPTTPPPAKYIAMGDSFSSGEGVPPFEYGTDTGSNTCHRSTRAYPRLLQNDPSLDLGATMFMACSGAVSDYIIDDYNQENVELPQAAYITPETELVTITIGGNDVGFGSVLITCTLATDQSGTTQQKHDIEHDACIDALDDARVKATSPTLQTKLEDVFSGLRDLGSTNLQVVVAGYPNLFPAYADISGSCVWGNGALTTSGRNIASDEVAKSRLLHDELNQAIEDAVTATGDTNVHFVNPTAAFSGHELCRPTPWFNNVVPSAFDATQRAQSYHPNSSGQQAYANTIKAKVITLP